MRFKHLLKYPDSKKGDLAQHRKPHSQSNVNSIYAPSGAFPPFASRHSEHHSPWRLLLVLLGVVLASRVATMALLPLMDTSEARYALIARTMEITGDWITPWFDEGVPFWGKPPLAFWAQALSYRALGYSEFAVRLPSLLAALITLGLMYQLTVQLRDRLSALLAMVIYSTTALGYVASGAVIMDPFLTVGSTLILVSLLSVARKDAHWIWGYAFFVGIACGLLAKGPLVLVLCGGPIVLWLMLSKLARSHIRSLPWPSGIALMFVLTLPWYIAAENKTPGFLRYFLIGEHILRFIDPGWAGDLYGNAHKQPRGMIWWQAMQATFPWGVAAIVILALRFREIPALVKAALERPEGLLLLWIVWSLVFLTFAGNILWTYVQPVLPAFAILLALALAPSLVVQKQLCTSAALLLPVGAILFAAVLWVNPSLAKTEKFVVESVDALTKPRPARLIYAGRPTFSAKYYSRNSMQSMQLDDIQQLLDEPSHPALYLIIRKRDIKKLSDPHVFDDPLIESRQYALVYVDTGSSQTTSRNDIFPIDTGNFSEWPNSTSTRRVF